MKEINFVSITQVSINLDLKFNYKDILDFERREEY